MTIFGMEVQRDLLKLSTNYSGRKVCLDHTNAPYTQIPSKLHFRATHRCRRSTGSGQGRRHRSCRVQAALGIPAEVFSVANDVGYQVRPCALK